ncbi:DUF4232 domain-containing protein [Streptomyces sp. ALB3]|uniref:DUF4232 domain-containing protein n=1 Tax=Streptomyces sp. ALB3 TaxID=3374278 RepID=UPI0037A00A5A
MRNLRFRRTARTSVLGTAALLAALSLTACQSDGPDAADDAASSASRNPAGGTSAAPAADKDRKPAGESGTSGSGSEAAKGSASSTPEPAPKQPKQPKDSGDRSRGALPVCAGTNTKLTVTSVPRPLNHMLLTVTNTGSKSCDAFAYPFLKFGGAQSVPAVFEESKPQAVITLAPGQSAYAGIRTSAADGSGTGGYSTQELSVGFQDANEGTAGQMVSVPLGEEVHVDSKLTVTYWQTGMDDALMY